MVPRPVGSSQEQQEVEAVWVSTAGTSGDGERGEQGAGAAAYMQKPTAAAGAWERMSVAPRGRAQAMATQAGEALRPVRHLCWLR